MAGKYAASTDVPVSRSRDEIERTLSRFGASAFGYMTSQDGTVAISFEFKTLRVLMKMQLPERSEFRCDTRGKVRRDSAIDRDWEQACRQRWRSLANGVKAKLALVDDGISTIEREFLSNIVVGPGGQTVGDRIVPQIEAMSRGDVRPELLELTGSIE